MKLNTIYNEDCLVGMNRIPDKSVDMILCDLPYGTTAIACLNTNRNYIGFELEREYFDKINQRIESYHSNTIEEVNS